MGQPTPRFWLRDELRPLLPIFREAVVISFFVNLLALTVPVFVMQVYDRVVFHSGVATLVGLVAGMAVAIVFDFSLRLVRAKLLQTVALRVDVSIGRRLFAKLVALPLADIEQRSAAAWHALFRDIDTIRNTLSGGSALLICDVPFLIFFLILLFVVAQPVAWVVVVMLPLFVVMAAFSARALAIRTIRERTQSVARDALIAEMIAGRTTIKALALDASLRPLWEERHAATIGQAIGRGALADGYATLGTSLTVVTTVAITAVGALAVLDQKLSIGALIAANMLSGRLVGPITQLIGNWRSFSTFLQAGERLGEVFRAPDDRLESAVALAQPRGLVALEDLTFAYDAARGSPDRRRALDGISLILAPGRGHPADGLHGFFGHNGSGKSTLLKVIQGLYPPARGRVLLDGADIAQFSRRELAAWMGYVPQDVVLFAGTLRANIALGHPTAEDTAILEAAMLAGVHRFIIDLPDGYATEVGEAGHRLSAGQRQRIAVARALVGRPPVLLMDEPTSQLDREGEAELRATLVKIAKSATVIVVTHSLSLLAVCRTVTVLEAGRIKDSGRADQVLGRLLRGMNSEGRTAGTGGVEQPGGQSLGAGDPAPAPAAVQAKG